MLRLLILLMFNVSVMFSLEPSDVTGFWYMPENEAGRVPVAEVFERNSKLYAVGFVFKNKQVSTATDVKNPDKALQSRLLREVVVVHNIEIDGNDFKNGTIYNPDNGKTFYLKGSLSKDGKTIEWKASVDKAGLFGKTLVWKKVENSSEYAKFRHSPQMLDKLLR